MLHDKMLLCTIIMQHVLELSLASIPLMFKCVTCCNDVNIEYVYHVYTELILWMIAYKHVNHGQVL